MAAEKDGVVKKGRGFQSKGSLASLHNNGRLSMQTPSSQWSTGVQKGEEDRVVKVKKEESSTVTKGVQRARGLTMNPRVLRINAPNGLDGIKAQDEDRDERIGALKPESVAPKEGQPTAATAAVQGVMWAYSLAPIAGRGHVRSKASDFWEDESQDFAHENPTKPRTPEKVNTPKTKRKRTPGSAGKSVLVDCYGSSPQPRWPLKKPPGIPNDHKWRGSQPSKPRPLSVPPLPRGRPLSPFITALRRYSAGPTGPMSIPPLIRHGRAPNVREIIPQGSLLTTEKHPGVMAGSHLNTLVGRLGTGIDTGTTATEPKAEVGQSRTGPPNMANPLETTGHPFRRPMNPPALPHSRVPVVRKILVPHAGFPTSQPSIPVAPSYGSSFPPSPPVLNMNESHPSFPPVTPKIPIKSEGLESPRPTKMTHRRSYTRGQEPRGQGDWDEGGGRGRDWREDLNNDHRRPTINRVLHTPRGPPLGPRFADSRYHGSSPLDISIRLATPRQAALEALSRDPLVRCGINRCRNWASRLAAPESISTARPMTLEDLARLYQAPQNSAVPPNSAVSQGTNASQASTTGNKTGGNSAAPQGANTRQASNKTDANSAVAQRTSTLQARTTIKQTDGNSAVPQGKTTLQATTTTKKSSENYAMPQGTEAIQAIMSPRSRVDPQLRPVVRLPTTGSLSDAALASRSGLTNAPIPPPVNYPMGPMTIRRGMSQENFETLASPQAPGPNGQQMQARNAMVVGFNVNVDEENENGGVNSQAPGWVPGPNQWSPGMPLRHQQQYWAPVMSQYGNEQVLGYAQNPYMAPIYPGWQGNAPPQMGFNSSYYCGGMHPFFAGGHPPPAAPMGAFFGPPVEEQMFAVATSDDQMPQAIRQNPAEVPVHGSYVADQRPQVRANSLSMERPNRDEINPCRLRDERSRSPKKDVDHRRSRLDMGHEILARNEQTALADADDLDDNDGPVGGRLPAALPCAICSTFHMAFTACTIPSNPCDICEGQHWTARCNVAALRIARVFRDGISCQKCRLMHRGSCPPPHSCPLCLTHHRGVCQPSPNACRYCGERHWENGCMRWEAKDEAMGFNTDKNPLAGRRKSVRFMGVDVMDPQKRGELPKTQPKKPEPKRTAKSAIIKIESDDEQYPIKTQPAAPALARAPSAPIFERAPSALFLSLPALATVNPPLVLAEPMKFPASLPPRPQVSREKDQQAQEWLERIERNRFPGFRQGQGPPNDHLSSMHLSDDVDDRPARLSDSTSTATLPADNSVNTNTCPGNEDNRSRPANENNRSRNRVPAAPGRKRNRNRSAETYRAVGESVRGYLDRYLPTYGGDRRGNDRGRGNQAQELDGSPEEERDPPPGGRKGAMAPKRRK